MAGLQSIAAFIFVFGLLVVFHEFGHFIAAKLSRVRVDEFAVGFGPPVLHRRVGETVYALRLIPLGGFVRLAGMDGSDHKGPRSAEAEPGQGFDFGTGLFGRGWPYSPRARRSTSSWRSFCLR